MVGGVKLINWSPHCAGTNIPQVAINDIGDEQVFLKNVDKTDKVFSDGDLVSGQVVRSMRFSSVTDGNHPY